MQSQAKLKKDVVESNKTKTSLRLVGGAATGEVNFASKSAATFGSTSTSTSAHLQKLKQVALYQKAVKEHGSKSSQAQNLFQPIYEQGFQHALALAFASRVTDPDTAQELAQLTMLRVWKRLTTGKEIITSVPGLISHSFHCERVNWLEKNFHERRQDKAGKAEAYPFPPYQASYATGTGGKLYEFGSSFSVEPLDLCRLIDPARFNNPEEVALASELSYQMQEILAQMPAHFRRAVIGQVAGKSLKELCSEYAWTLDQTKKYLAGGKTWLKVKLAGLGM